MSPSLPPAARKLFFFSAPEYFSPQKEEEKTFPSRRICLRGKERGRGQLRVSRTARGKANPAAHSVGEKRELSHFISPHMARRQFERYAVWRRKRSKRAKSRTLFRLIFFGGRLRWTANVIGTMGAGINFSRERRRRRAIGCTAAHFEAKPEQWLQMLLRFSEGASWVFAAAVRCQKGDFSVLFWS